VRPTGSKRVRASPVSSQAEVGNIKIVRGRWNKAFLDELVMFDEGAHDDQVDALSGAFEYLTRGSRPVRLRARSVGRW
ncbi:MAG TPA: phage terminase large subunit, partial [Tissierellia bacterium]|nr:phage terminase large subunit [Tissierellia bacterium]